MSTQAPTDSKSPVTKNSSDILGIPKIISNNTDGGDSSTDLYSDNSVGGAARRNRIAGDITNNKERNNLLYLSFFSKAGLNVTSSALDEKSQEQLSKLSNTVRTVSSVLGTAGVVTFAFSTALAAMGLKPDKLKPVKTGTPDKLAKAVAEEGAEAAAKPAAKILAEEGAEAAAKPAAKILAEEGAEAAAKGFFGKLLGGLGIAGKFLKRVPVVGALITGGFVAYEVGSFAMQGDTKNAFAAAAAGGGEMAGNIVGFGAGDALREGIRSAFVVAGGSDFEALAKSDIRAVGEMGFDLVQEFTGAAAPQTAAYTPTPSGFNPALKLAA